MNTSKHVTHAFGDDLDLLRARERFLEGDQWSGGTSEHAPSKAVDRMILTSWTRSRDNHVGVDHVVTPPAADWDRSSPLLEGARPVLESLRQRLSAEPVSLILTDQTGLVLDRQVTDPALQGRLDKVSLAPGFRYSEELVGTNGIGTAIESGHATLISGHAHYVGDLGRFICAGVPLRHPTRGVTIGVLDLTSWAQHAPGAILATLAMTAAQQIEEELLARSSTKEFALFEAYLHASRRPGSMVVAMGSGATMMTESVRLLLGPDERNDLLSYAGTMLDRHGGASVRAIELSSGRQVHVRRDPVGDGRNFAGAVFTVRLLRQSAQDAPSSTPSFVNLPGLAGNSPPWQRCIKQIRHCYLADERFVLCGEPGTGKKALLRAVHLQHNPAHGFAVLHPPMPADVPAWARKLDEVLSSAAMLVIAHADDLPEAATTALAQRLRQGGSAKQATRVAATITSEHRWEGAVASAFSATVQVPPLRHHLDDLPQLGALLIAKTSRSRTPPVLSETVLAQLARHDWPGNITQLGDLLAELVKHHRSGTIELHDLPLGTRATGHHRLSPIESLERDAIIEALLDNAQKPAAAAAALGISRATIYRKLHRYGISLPIPQ